MKRLLAFVLLLSLGLMCLPKEFFHDHEEGITSDSRANIDENCFVCDLDYGLFEATISIGLSILLVCFIVGFLLIPDAFPPIFYRLSSNRGPPTFSY